MTSINVKSPVAPPNNWTIASSTLVHTDIATVHGIITTQLTDLIAVSSVESSVPYNHVFTSSIIISRSASGKPSLQSFTYSLHLHSDNDVTDPTNTLITITTVPDVLASSPVPITGVITLSPEAHGTTQLKLQLILEGVSQGCTDSVSPQVVKEGKEDKEGVAEGLALFQGEAKEGGTKTMTLPKSPRVKSANQTTTSHPKALEHILSLVPTLHKRFARYDEVDEARLLAFEAQVKNPPPILPHEDNLVSSSVTNSSGWKRIAGTVRESVAFFHKTANNSNWGKAVATIDAPASRLFAHRYIFPSSYESIHNQIDEEGADALYKVIDVPNTRTMFAVNVVRLGFGVSDRVFKTRFAWRKQGDGSFLLAFAPLDEFAEPSPEAEPAEPLPSKKLPLAERLAASQVEREKMQEASLEDDFLEDDFEKNTSQDTSTGTKSGTMKGTGRNPMSTIKNMTAKLLRPKKSPGASPAASPQASLVTELNDLVSRDPIASKAVRATVRGFWRFRPLAPSVCEVSYVVQVSLSGSIPKELFARRKKQTLSVVRTTRDKYERKGAVVDAEMRAAFPLPPRLSQLDEQQRLTVDRCVALEQTEGGGLADWTPISSRSPFVKMWSRLPEKKMGERQIAIVRTSTIVDCSPHQALAWLFDFGSRVRQKESIESGNPARLVWKQNSPHDNFVATIKKAPFPLLHREFVFRQLCLADDGVFSYFSSSVDETVDYGFKNRAIRGSTTAVMRFKPVEGRTDQCEFSLVQHFDLQGRVPVFVLNAHLPKFVGFVISLRENFERDDQVDEMERDELARVIKDERQVYSEDEDSLIQRVQDKLGALKGEDFEELESPDHLVKMEMNMLGEAVGVGRACAVIDASIEVCAAWEMAKMSREQLKKPSLLKTLTAVNSHNHVYHTVNDNVKVPGFLPREFVARRVWRQQDAESLVIVYEDFEHADYPMRSEYVRGSSRTICAYAKLPPVSGVPQTLVTMTAEIGMGGNIPRAGLKIGASRGFRAMSVLRKRFDKSSEIDCATRARNVGLIAEHADEFSEEENAVLEEGGKHFADFKETKARSLKMASPLTTGEIAFKKKDSHAWGRSTTTVRARPEEVLAFLWDTMRRSAQREDDLEKSVEEQVNGHNMLVYNKKRTPKIIADRDFLGRAVWKKEGDGFVLVSSPEESGRRVQSCSSGSWRALSGVLPASIKSRDERVVRGKYPSAMRIKRKNDKEATLDYVIHPDSGGSIPSFVASRWMNITLAKVTEVQEYFQALRGLEEWDADDGRAVGEVMCIKTKAERHREKGESKVGARIRELFKKQQGLRQIAEKYEFFQPMMVRVMENKLRTSGDVETKLCSVSVREGRKIGAGLSLALASHLTAEAGVNEWMGRFASLNELDKEEAWFRTMLDVVAKRLLGEVSWGLKMRVITGAGLSILDLATDVFVIVRYVGKDDTRHYGWILLGMIVSCLALQSAVAIIQNKARPWKVASEVLVVLTGLKPAFGSYRVCSGKAMEEHHVFDAKTELVFSKSIEMVAESIPGCAIQAYVLLKQSDTISVATVGSLLVSAMTTGFSSATISFDFDVDPDKRKLEPHFYGFIPDGGSRTVIFGCMLVNSALMLLIRSFSTAVIMNVNKRYFVAYWAADMALYLLQKVARGDFHYWVPVNGALGLFMSLMVRVIVKTIADFTGLIQFRGPQEMGGLYWTVNMFLALLASFVSVFVYYADTGEAVELITTGQNSTAFEIEERVAWTLVGSLSGAWVVVFGVFLLLMKKEYRQTFYSTMTGKQQIMDKFKSEDDAMKATVLKKNKKIWRPIRGEVKEWVQAGYWRWVEEKPLWFTEAWISKVPEDFIPADEDQQKLKDIRKGRPTLGRGGGAGAGPDTTRVHPVVD